jgi:mannose-6-phosphate isomerase-like protein (cupin superfamily)
MILNKLEKIVQSVDINITENQLLDFLKNIKRWPYKYPWGQGSVEIINNLGTLNKELFFSSKNNFGSNYLDFEKWIYYYDLGYTTIISNILDLTKELRILEKKLSDAIGSNINANFYFSKPGQLPSFEPHAHSYHVIVKQIYGNSEWQIENKKLILKPKKTLIVPKNTLHAVINKLDKKLSLTINIE